MKIHHKIDETEWRKEAEACEYATFFHTPSWLKIFTDTYDEMENATIKIEFKDGKKALIPLIKSKNSNIEYLNCPAGTYGEWISGDILSDQQEEKIAKWMNSHLKSFVTRINPYKKKHPQLFNNYKTYKIKKDFTQILNLEKGYDSVYNFFSKGHKYNIKKSKNLGVKIKIATTINEYLDYFKIYQNSLERWGNSATNNYPIQLFINIFKHKNNNIKLWVAEINNKIISGSLVFYHLKHLVWWHGATLSSFFNLYPANYLQDRIIKNACDKKFIYFDFNPSGSHIGVEKFKRSFGAKNVSSNVIIRYKSSPLINFLSKIEKNVKKIL